MDDILHFECKKTGEDNDCVDPPLPSLDLLNLKLEDIVAIFEPKQLGRLDLNSDGSKIKLYAHKQHGVTGSDALVSLLQDVSVGTDVEVLTVSDTPGVPPSSLMSFIKASPNITGVVLAEHGAQYTNPYYHSSFDSTDQIRLDRFCQVVQIYLNSVYSLANETMSKNLTIDCNVAKDLFICLSHNLTCEYSRLFFGLAYDQVKDSDPNFYASIYRLDSLITFTKLLLRQFLYGFTSREGIVDCAETQNCGKYECILNQCVQSNTFYHDAFPLGFRYRGFDPFWGNLGWEIVDSTNYPLYTESV